MSNDVEEKNIPTIEPVVGESAEEDSVDLDTLGNASASPEASGSAQGPTSTDAATGPETLAALTTEYEGKIAGLNDRYLRLMAEFDNYKRRTSREYETIREQATERLMVDIVEVKDNFDRALLPGKDAIDYDTFHKGMQLIDEKLSSVLQKHGLSSFGEVGEPFNPEVHDALMKQPHASIAEDGIVQVFDKGYRLSGKVIKHARVIVSAGTSAPLGAGASPGADVDKDDEALFEPKP